MTQTEIIRNQSPYVTVRIAAQKYFFVSVRAVRQWCASGKFKSARKPGRDWQILRAEIMAHLAKSHKLNEN
jgi:hypothetical protein